MATDSPPYPDTKPRAFRFTPLMESMFADMDNTWKEKQYFNRSEWLRELIRQATGG